MCRCWYIIRCKKKDYFFKYLAKATGDVPPTYNDEVKFLLVALYESGLGGKGDELYHVSNAIKAVTHGFDPRKLPLLYKNEIQKLSENEQNVILNQYHGTPHSETIFNLLFLQCDTVGNAEEHNVGTSGNILTPPDID